MQKVICPYCGRVAKYVDSSVIYYGHSYGMAYLCRPCNAYVGVHSGTDRPKGSLANAELRGWRKATHARFDPLWQDGPFKKRNAAYYRSRYIDAAKTAQYIEIGQISAGDAEHVTTLCKKAAIEYKIAA